MSSGRPSSPGRTGWPRAALAVVLALAALLGGYTLLDAQEQPLTVKLTGFHADGWSRAQAVVTVLDSAAEPVSGLSKADFTTQVNGAAVPSLGLSTGIDSSLPLVVVFAIDVGAGMQGDGLTQAKLAAGQFLDGLGAQDSVAVLAYGDAPHVVQPFTQDRAAVRAAIDGLSAGGGPALYGATAQGIFLASAQADTGRRAVVLLSEQVDTGSPSRQDALFAAKALGVPVFPIGLGAGIDREFLRELADASGGQFAEATAPDGLAQKYQDVSKLLREQYVLTVDASGIGLGAAEPATLHVQVTADGRSGSDNRLVCAQRVCVALTDVVASETVATARTITAQVVSADSVTSVTLLVDGAAVAKATQAPYSFTLTPGDFPKGDHIVAAEVATAAGVTRSEGVAVRLAGPAAGGGTTLFAGVAIVGAIVALAATVYVWRRRRRAREAPLPSAPTPSAPPDEAKPRGGLRLIPRSEEPPTPRAQPEVALGRITAVDGPLAGQAFPVGSAPVSVGSAKRCDIQLPEPDGDQDSSFEYARVWIRDDRLVLHELRRLTAAGPVGARWELLTSGDVFSIGRCSFLVELTTSGAESPPEPDTAPPSDAPSANVG